MLSCRIACKRIKALSVILFSRYHSLFAIPNAKLVENTDKKSRFKQGFFRNSFAVQTQKYVWPHASLTLSCLIFYLVMLVSCDVWLSLLTKKYPEDQKSETNLIIYASFVGASFIFLIIRALGFFMVSLRCSERLHDKMVAAVLQAPVVFFDLNSVGRIMNRFSKDIGCMDEVLPKKFLRAVQRTLLMFTSILLPTVINPWLLFVVVPIAIIAGLISRYYLKTSRELQRLESVSRSPVFSHISETLDGLDTIRTRKKEEDFLDEFCRYFLFVHYLLNSLIL